MRRLRIAMVLAGLGRVRRGAEAAFLELAWRFRDYADLHVELFGTGLDGVRGVPVHEAGCVPRERFEGWPKLPCLRSEYEYEELTFVLSLAWARRFRPGDFDLVVSCSYPFVNWFLQRHRGRGGPAHVFVTQNGDWMCRAVNREYRFFRCDGLVCTNPEYFDRHRDRYRCVLIPNGVDPAVFRPPDGTPERMELPPLPGVGGRPVVLMASALIASKAVAEGVRAIAQVPEAYLAIAGDGPQRAEVTRLLEEALPGRHALLGSVPREQMPALYRRADVFLHASRTEPSALAYLEAASTGLPLVVHDGSVPRWTLGETALYADTRDPAAVADALRQALDPKVGSELGRRARQRMLAGWSWEHVAAQYRDFFYQLAGVRSRSAVGMGC